MEVNKEMLQKAFEQFRDVMNDYIDTEIQKAHTELSVMQKQLIQANDKNVALKFKNSALEAANEKLKKQLEAANKPVADPVKDEVKAININIDDETAEKLSKEIKDMLDSLGNGDSFFNKLLKGF